MTETPKKKKHDHSKAPTCGFCNWHHADWSGYIYKDGRYKYKYHINDDGSKTPVCRMCQAMLAQENGRPHVWNARNGKQIDYRRYKMEHEYCENKDGRLGFVCSAEIRWPTQLTVDHILENFHSEGSNAPEHLQTLCCNCHAYKNYLVSSHKVNKLFVMVKMSGKSKDISWTDDEIMKQVDIILKKTKSTPNTLDSLF